MDDIFLLGFGVALGIIGFIRGFTVRNKKKLIENIPTSKARSIAMGLVEIEGTAQSFNNKLLESPFSKAQSIFYRYEVEEKCGKNSWRTIAKYETPDLFYVEDETGKVLIDPKGGELQLDVDHNYSTGLFSMKHEAEFKSGLEAIGINWQSFFGFERTLRCDEVFIKPGDRIYVMGTASDNPLKSSSEENAENILIGKKNSDYFCISDKSQKELLSALTFKTFLYFYGGPILTIICLFLIIMFYF